MAEKNKTEKKSEKKPETKAETKPEVKAETKPEVKKETKAKTKKWLIPTICGVVIAAVIAVIVVVVVNVVKPGLVGVYTLSATIDSEGTESTATADFMKALGLNYTIEFKDDGTGVLKTEVATKIGEGDEGSEGEDDRNMVTNFTYANGKIKAENDAGIFEADYELKDGAIILNIAGEIMKFSRS